MAIPMPIVQDIRRLDRQGMSRAQIARRLHVDRGTVAKYADMEDCSPKPKADRRYGSKIDPYAHLVDEWLEADRLLPRKQRHTIRRVHDRLLAETDYDGEYSTTMRYVHRWREANRGVPDREGYVRLEWAAGSMQVDFGVARARIAGEMADVHCLVVSLPYSNMRLCVALPGENAECLCHGLMLVFEHIGGVPPVIVMDNATGAGRRNAKGEVALTGVFSAFVAHYRLEVRFCNPYSGNEKGSVENAVGFLRRNLMVPPMRAESYGQLSRLLLERCDGLARDSYCPRLLDVPVAEVFDEERAALMPLPSTAFDPVRWESRTADKYGLVDIDSNRYLAGPDSARSRVLAAIRWDTVTLTSPATGELFAEYPRQYGRSRNVEDPALVLPRLAVKPRAWRESSIRPDVPDDIRAWLDSMDEKTLRESLKAIGDACRAAGFDPAMQACGEILRSNRDMGLHADSLTPIALRMRDGEWEYPGGIEEPDLSGYDRFITGTSCPSARIYSTLSSPKNAPCATSWRRENRQHSSAASGTNEAVTSLSAFSTTRSPVFWNRIRLRLASIYSAMSVCQSRWLGATLVMTATCGLCAMRVSWKLDSSTTTTWSGCTFSISGSSGRPMLPPRCTVLPDASSSPAMMVVVVVLPSDPVTP